MALLDFLKRKKEVKKSEKKAEKVFDKEKSAEEELKTESERDTFASKEIQHPIVQKKVRDFSYEAIKQPHISEKATYLAEKNQYVFEVLPKYNKKEIKKAIEGIYRVDVLSVNLIKIPAKKRRLGRIEGFRKSYKKAIVKIKEGQKIEII